MLGIKDLHLATDRPAGLEELVPLEAPEAFIEWFSHALLPVESKQVASLTVEVVDVPGRVRDDDALVDRIENGLKEALFVREPVEIVLHVLGADAADAFNQFVKESGVHGGGTFRILGTEWAGGNLEGAGFLETGVCEDWLGGDRGLVWISPMQLVSGSTGKTRRWGMLGAPLLSAVPWGWAVLTWAGFPKSGLAAPPGGAQVDSAGVPSWAEMSWIENGQVRVGVDLKHGGALVFLSRDGGGNLINNHDFGRQVQLSFYAGPVPYAEAGQEPAAHWAHLGWNPVQTGDDFGNGSRVTFYENNGRRLHVRCVPLQWPLNGVAGECEFDSWLELDGFAVRGRAQLTNRRRDRTLYPARLQELPAVYANAAFFRVVSYTGSNPFAGEVVSEIPKSAGPHPWGFWLGTEGWSALLDESGDGLGVITPGRVDFTGGFAGRRGANDTLGNSTGYLAGQAQEFLDHNICYSFDYELVPGTLEEIRERAILRGARKLPVWVFQHDRQGWHSRNGTASGWPLEGGIRLGLEQVDPQWQGPPAFWKAEEAPYLIVEGAFRMRGGEVTVFWRRHGLNAPDPEDHTRFAVVPDGIRRRYSVALRDVPNYRGGMVSLRIDPGEGGEPGGWAELSSVALSDRP